MSHIKTDKLSARTASGTITLGESGETITVPSGVTLTNNGTASGFGKVLQVVNTTYGSQESTTSTSFVATSLTASITPSSTSSKIFVLVHSSLRQEGANHVIGTIYRDATNLGDATWGMGQSNSHALSVMNCSLNWLDSPSTTSSTTYTFYFRSYTGVVVYSSVYGETGSITLMEIAA